MHICKIETSIKTSNSEVDKFAKKNLKTRKTHRSMSHRSMSSRTL